jgi:hypothetical protein
MKAYWWRGDDGPKGPKTNNFGDRITAYVLNQLGLTNEWAEPEDAELILVGSILEQLPHDWSGTICGAGKLHERSRIHLSDARVFALRGKLTLAGVTGLGGQKPVLGDPGLLVSHWVRQPVAKYDLGVVPHWSDKELAGRYSYGHVIDPTQTVQKVVEEIAACKRIVSSSLHGCIVADAFGIPRRAEMPSTPASADKLLPHEDSKNGGDFKFRDYASVFDGDPHFGEMWLAPRHRVEEIQRDLFNAITTATGIDLSTENRRHPQVSMLVPFRDDGEHRSVVWNWLRRYWRATFPEAEIIQGTDHGTPFSKAVAVNHAASLARGRTFVVIDADAYLPAAVLKGCANDIDLALSKKQREWFIPYNELFRLSEAYTMDLLETSPTTPIPLPPPMSDVEVMPPGASGYGHTYGAMCQVMPREAFGLVHGMDPRFRGWGGEDQSFLRALDTLYTQHKVVPGDIAHFWHARIGRVDSGMTRRWIGQSWSAANSRLSQRYAQAVAEPSAMRGLANEHPLGWTSDLVQTADGDSV